MKRILISLALIAGISLASYAQNAKSGAKVSIKSTTTESASVVTIQKKEVKTVSSGIVASLKSSLNLTEKQKSKVSAAVTSFLKGKAKIAELATANQTEYSQKLMSLTRKLNAKLKGTLSAEQFTKYNGLKSTTVSGSAMSQLFN
ncbi:MAG TPA: hypothetical protein PLJ84_02195 [Bacteroidales bacterium]|nr:hypothetical protein [Bacteroidales bacterium]HPT01380.1 hypothetical protein [Bacteroidales bacterium]